MPRFVICLGALFALMVSLGASIQTTRAAELVMVERDGCPRCDAFDRDLAPIFTRASEGRRAPLRRIDLYKPVPADLAFLQIERLTPLFILVDEGREIGRIRGYPGQEGFWTQLSMLMDRLPQSATAREQASLTTSLRADH